MTPHPIATGRDSHVETRQEDIEGVLDLLDDARRCPTGGERLNDEPDVPREDFREMRLLAPHARQNAERGPRADDRVQRVVDDVLGDGGVVASASHNTGRISGLKIEKDPQASCR